MSRGFLGNVVGIRVLGFLWEVDIYVWACGGVCRRERSWGRVFFGEVCDFFFVWVGMVGGWVEVGVVL